MRSPAVDVARLTRVVEDACAGARGVEGGEVASYIPELARVPRELFAVTVCTLDGETIATGDATYELTIQSMVKPFLYAAALARHGREAVHACVDVEPSGDAFDSIVRLEQNGRPHNPMVNAGAIAVAGLLCHQPGALSRLLDLLGRLVGRRLYVDVPTYRSERATGDRNRAIAHLLDHFGKIAAPVEEALDLYFQACSVLVTCADLAVMAATIAAGGVHPVHGERVLEASAARDVMAIMTTSGMYDAAGQFAFDVGLPAKSGVSGGILAVVPGRLGIGVFSPPLDRQGNSLRGLGALRRIAERLELHPFEARIAARPVIGRAGAVPVASRGLRQAMERALEAARGVDGGAVASYGPELAAADPERLALVASDVDGEEIAVGDADVELSLQAAGNPFAYALALEAHGLEAVGRVVGVEPSGNPYNAIVLEPDGRPHNPMSNAGAIAVAGLAAGHDAAERSRRLLDGMAAFAGERRLPVDVAVLSSERAAGARNRAIAHLLRNFGVVRDVDDALERYFEQCSLVVTARLLARMAATLAAGGREPRTGVRVIDAAHVRPVLGAMFTCGMHDSSGRFAFEVGLPAKSGISGAIVAVVPGRMGLCAYAPRVDAHAASVRGHRALATLARDAGLGVFG